MHAGPSTEIMNRYLAKILAQAPGGTVVIGGWAVHALVAHEFALATSKAYPLPPDISLFVPAERLLMMQELLEYLEVWRGAMPFRYTGFVDRDNSVTLSKEEAEMFPLHQLVFVDVNLFTDPESPGAFHLPGLRKELQSRTLPVPFYGAAAAIPEPSLLLSMKCKAYSERLGEDRAIKDACDILALVAYGGASPSSGDREAIRGILQQDEDSRLMAAELLGGRDAFERLRKSALQ
jgi:hypothetical protein